MAKRASNVRGTDRVMRNLNKELRKIRGRTTEGLLESAAFIRRDMDTTSPVIPVDQGHLRNSWFTNLMRKLTKVIVVMGFTANYAVFVHENVDASFKRPGAGAKFFEKAIKRNTAKILNIVASKARIKR